MLNVKRTNRFVKSYVLCTKRGYDIEELKTVMQLLTYQLPLPERCRPHKLHGNYLGCWECRIKPDWLLVYRYDFQNNQIIFEDTGTHADLF